MPVVPVRPPVQQVGTAPLPGVRQSPQAPPEAFGKPAGPDLSGLTSVIAQMQARETAHANQIAVNDADNQATALRDKVLYDPQNGVLTKHGKDAFAAPDQALGDWKQGIAQIQDGLGNDEQKLAFQNRVDFYDHSLHLEIQSHIQKERDIYDKQTTDGYVENRVADATRAFADEKLADANIEMAIAAKADYAKRRGAPLEWIKAESDQIRSGARLSILQQLLTAREADGGGDLRASRYLAVHRADFQGRDLEEADRLTDAGSVLGESQRNADSILKVATTLDDALKQAAEIAEPKVRLATERLARQHFADMAASDRDARNAAFTRSSIAIQKGATVDQLPITDRVLLSPDEYLQLDHVAQRIRNPVVETQPSYYTHWMNLAGISGQSQQEFLNHDFGKDRAAGKLSEQDFHHFTSLQLQLRHRDETADARDERAAASQMTRLRRSEESQVFKQGKAALEADRISARTDSLFKGAPKSPRPQVTVPRWMLDSAQTDPEYKDYLKLHGVNVDSAAAPVVKPPPPKAPGAPIP